MKHRIGFILLDAVVGMCVISIVALMVFAWTKNQRSVVDRLYLSDLAHRTVTNVMVRDIAGCGQPEVINGFELTLRDGKIVLRIADRVFEYGREGEPR